jgi:hypothetical protein
VKGRRCTPTVLATPTSVRYASVEADFLVFAGVERWINDNLAATILR